MADQRKMAAARRQDMPTAPRNIPGPRPEMTA
jgi:hypothetical protein